MMKNQTNGVRLFLLLFSPMVFSVGVSAQQPGQQPATAHVTSDAEHMKFEGTNPKPEDATKAILSAFDEYEVIGMSAAHGNKDLDDFILRLIRNPAFPSKVNDVVVECGNSLYQPILDRYIAGDDVPLSDVRQIWRNTTPRLRRRC